MRPTLLCRRERLAAMLHNANDQLVVFSEGFVGTGCAFYEQVIARQLEGGGGQATHQPLPAGSPERCPAEDQATASCPR